MSLLETELKKFANSLTEEVIQNCFALALENGGVFAELFFEDVCQTRVLIEGKKVDQLNEGRDRGVGFRVIHERRTYYAYTTDLQPEALETLARNLADAVRGEGGGKSVRSVSEWQPSLQRDKEIAQYKVKRSPREIGLKDKIEIAKRIENAAYKELPNAKQVSAMVGDSHRRILIVNSDGLISSDEKIYFQMISQVVGVGGESGDRIESAYESDGGYVGLEFMDEVSPEEIGRLAAKRVSLLLKADPAPSGTMPVVMASEAGGTMIHEAVGHGLEADLACNGLSVYQGKLGEKVASPLITVVDDGTMPEKRGSYAFDDEGTPSKKNVLIQDGVLQSYMVDRLSAMKFDLMATGNGRRESFRHLPIVRMTNTYVAPGRDDPKKILSDTSWGLYVQAMGGGQVNTVTGDFVFAVTEGYLIRDGKLEKPIRGATLVGNGPKVISIVDRVGNDLDFMTGTCGKDGQGAPVTDAQPTMRIPELTVGGEVPMETYFKAPA